MRIPNALDAVESGQLGSAFSHLQGQTMTRKSADGKSDAVRPLEMHRGSVIVSDDFNAPLPPDLLALFVGESETPKAKSSKKPAASKRRRISPRKSRGK
jgi:hypothetical protein